MIADEAAVWLSGEDLVAALSATDEEWWPGARRRPSGCLPAVLGAAVAAVVLGLLLTSVELERLRP